MNISEKNHKNEIRATRVVSYFDPLNKRLILLLNTNTPLFDKCIPSCLKCFQSTPSRVTNPVKTFSTYPHCTLGGPVNHTMFIYLIAGRRGLPSFGRIELNCTRHFVPTILFIHNNDSITLSAT